LYRASRTNLAYPTIPRPDHPAHLDPHLVYLVLPHSVLQIIITQDERQNAVAFSDARICESGSPKMMHNGGNAAKLKIRLSKSSPFEVKMLVEFIRREISV